MPLPNPRILRAFGSVRGAVFIESGTFHGDGVRRAVKAGFKKVISIEPAREFYDECSASLSDEIAKGRVTLIHGGSERCLGEVLKTVDAPVVYWLDGHFQGVETDAVNCPVASEVDAILEHGIGPSDVVMIDDVRLLKKPDSWRGHAVSLPHEIGRLSLAAPGHVAMFLNGHVPDDIFVLVPGRIAKRVLRQRKG